MVIKTAQLESILGNFLIYGDFIKAIPFGSGHINDTLLVTFNQAGQEVKYILRKINRYVFKKPKLIIENTVNVTEHIRKRLSELNEAGLSSKVMTLVKTNSNKYYYVDEENNYWCVVLFIEGAYTVDNVETEEQAFEAARAYGMFQKYLSDFDVSKCHITIKDFHNLSNRIITYKESIKKDVGNRVKSIPKEISLAEKFSYINEKFSELQNKKLPVRITHNDTKINNIMLHAKTNKGLCVVDLDTVMPGIILNDFGDMVRTFTSPALEDEKDFSKVKMRLNIFDALTNGYLSELKHNLTEDEINNFVLGAKIIVYEQAIRFLTDYLEGDVYYKVDYSTHNLNRAKNQFALLVSIEEQTEEMHKIVKRYS